MWATPCKAIAMYLSSKAVDRIIWPPQIPDIAPIENAWGLLNRRLRKRRPFPKNEDHLFSYLCEEWNAIPDSYFTDLAGSMIARVKLV